MVFSKVVTPVGELVLTASDTALTGVFFPTSRRGPAPSTRRVGRSRYRRSGRRDSDARAPTARGVFRAQTHDVRVTPRSAGVGIRASCVECAAPDPLWLDDELRRARQAPRRQARHPCRGLANGKNPIPIIVPCHRVVGSKGELTGFGGDWIRNGGCWSMRAR